MCFYDSHGLIVTRMFAGSAMNNLALTYGALGRHTDALVMREKVLQFRRRVLPEDHPDIGDVDVFL